METIRCPFKIFNCEATCLESTFRQSQRSTAFERPAWGRDRFNQHGSFDRLLAQGRWAEARTARVYLNDGLAQLADMSPSNSFLLPYVNLYCKSPNLQPGPPQGRARSGGRGGAKKGKSIGFVFHDFAQARRNFSE